MYSTENHCLILKFYFMKNLNTLIIFALFFISISSCTPQAIEKPTDSIANAQATGSEGENTNDGTKD